MFSVCLEVKCFRKTFSAFSDIWGAVKSKLTEKVCNLTGKSLCKLRKTVYGKFFHKPFSKMREAFCSLSLLSLLSAQTDAAPSLSHRLPQIAQYHSLTLARRSRRCDERNRVKVKRRWGRKKQKKGFQCNDV